MKRARVFEKLPEIAVEAAHDPKGAHGDDNETSIDGERN